MAALSARAQASGLLGRKRDARDALAALERTFERLPRDVTREKTSVTGWSEVRLHHVRSYTAAFGDVAGGVAAREEALRLYPAIAWRGTAQVKLHRAAAESDAEQAVAVLRDLSEPQRADRSVRLIAVRALAACESSGADARELREALA